MQILIHLYIIVLKMDLFIVSFFYAALCIALVLDKLVLALTPKTVCSDDMWDKVTSFIMI